MSQREGNYFIADHDDDDDRDEEDDVEGRAQIDSDDSEDHDDDQDGHISDTGSTLDSLPGDEDGNGVEHRNGGDEVYNEEDDAMTWESRSTISETDSQSGIADEWYPMNPRNSTLPNFALPTSTRSYFEESEKQMLPQRISNTTERSVSPPATLDTKSIVPSGNEYTALDDASYKFDEEFQRYEDVMRPEPSRSELVEVVLDYFIHHGHTEVIETFCKEMKIEYPHEEIKEMNIRNEVRDMILNGKMEEAIKRMLEISPDILKDDDVNFEVRKQHIIEMIREGEQSTKPVEYFRRHLMRKGKRPEDDQMEIIEKVFTLMVFAKGEDSEFHVYYDQAERERTAKEVNCAILGSMGKLKNSKLDFLAKSIAYVRGEVCNESNSPKSTTAEWATRFFATPNGIEELVEKAKRHTPIRISDEFF